MSQSLLKQIEALQNEECSEYNVDQWDFEDDTVAKVVEKGKEDDNNVEDDDFGYGRNLRHRQKNDDFEGDSRYKGKIVSRSALDSDSPLEEDYENTVATYSEESFDSQNDDGQESFESSEQEGEEEHLEYVRSFAKVDVEQQTAKAKAVQKQIKLYEQLLSARIRFQKILSSANQLPRGEEGFNQLVDSDATLKRDVKNCYRTVQRLLDNLLALRESLCCTNSAIRNSNGNQLGGTDEDDEQMNEPPAKLRRNFSLDQYENLLANVHQTVQPYQNDVLRQWYDKTRVANVRSARKDFSAFETDILKQIEYIMSDKSRLRRRTQLKRSEYNIIGQRPGEEEAEYDQEIFDDDDFYEQLLRELITSRSEDGPMDADEMGRRWVRLQKLKSKKKKRKAVDTKASKGRTLRFDAHGKLVNFMAPFERSKLSDEARSELFASLFGNCA